MPQRISLTNFFNQIESRYLGKKYQRLDIHECHDFLFPSSSDKSQNESEQLKNAYEISEDQKPTSYSPIQRIMSQNFDQTFEMIYEIHHGFTLEQISIIENALLIVVNRLFKPEILQNMYRICGQSNYFIEDNVWSKSNLTRSAIYYDKYLLLQYQLTCLKTKSESCEFPTINIYPKNKTIQKENQIENPSVTCISHESTFLIDGEFEIELDQHKLNGSGKNSSNAIFWAGVIVYEMLKNLGHRREKNSFQSQSQINVFKNCFLNDGFYFLTNNKNH